MNDIKWLTTCAFDTLVKHEYNWDVVLVPDATIRVECLWRLLESDHIVLTSEDHGHQFGLPSPIDAIDEVNRRLRGLRVTSAHCREGTLDLSVGFANGHVLEILPDSSGYEAWQLSGRNTLAVAVGGGRLDVFHDRRASGG